MISYLTNLIATISVMLFPPAHGQLIPFANWSNKNCTKPMFLMHFNGSNGSTTFVEEAGASVTTVVSAPAISTTQSKFGGSSLYLDGSSALLFDNTSNRYDLGTAAWTIEAWVYPTSAGRMAVSIGNYTATGYSISLDDFSGGRAAITNHNSTPSTIAMTMTANTWTHVALVRNANTLTSYVNGTSAGTLATALDYSGTNFTHGIHIGSLHTYGSVGTPNYFFIGYVDEVRFTKSAVYTSNFTAPTAAFPDCL